MSKITVQIGFYLENEHYAQMQAFLPRTEALKIPQLQIQHKTNQLKQQQTKLQKANGRGAKNQPYKSQKSDSKKVDSEDQINEEQEENLNEMQNEQQDQNEEEDQMIDDDQIVEDKVDSQKQEENLMRYLEEDDDSEDDDIDEDDDDLSSISRSMSMMKKVHRTKRQKGDRQGLQQLPDRRPRKDKKLDQATQIIRREEKQRKRKQYLKKQVEAQQKATLDKILNETGRKLKMREEKQNQDEKKRQDKRFSNLGDMPKVITIQNQQGSMIMLHNVKLFPESMTRAPQIRIKPQCNKCGAQEGRYKIKNTNNFACSLNCYKLLV